MHTQRIVSEAQYRSLDACPEEGYMLCVVPMPATESTVMPVGAVMASTEWQEVANRTVPASRPVPIAKAGQGLAIKDPRTGQPLFLERQQEFKAQDFQLNSSADAFIPVSQRLTTELDDAQDVSRPFDASKMDATAKPFAFPSQMISITVPKQFQFSATAEPFAPKSTGAIPAVPNLRSSVSAKVASFTTPAAKVVAQRKWGVAATWRGHVDHSTFSALNLDSGNTLDFRRTRDLLVAREKPVKPSVGVSTQTVPAFKVSAPHVSQRHPSCIEATRKADVIMTEPGAAACEAKRKSTSCLGESSCPPGASTALPESRSDVCESVDQEKGEENEQNAPSDTWASRIAKASAAKLAKPISSVASAKGQRLPQPKPRPQPQLIAPEAWGPPALARTQETAQKETALAQRSTQGADTVQNLLVSKIPEVLPETSTTMFVAPEVHAAKPNDKTETQRWPQLSEDGKPVVERLVPGAWSKKFVAPAASAPSAKASQCATEGFAQTPKAGARALPPPQRKPEAEAFPSLSVGMQGSQSIPAPKLPAVVRSVWGRKAVVVNQTAKQTTAVELCEAEPEETAADAIEATKSFAAGSVEMSTMTVEKEVGHHQEPEVHDGEEQEQQMDKDQETEAVEHNKNDTEVAQCLPEEIDELNFDNSFQNHKEQDDEQQRQEDEEVEVDNKDKEEENEEDVEEAQDEEEEDRPTEETA